MALYIPHTIFHLAWLLYMRSETFEPYYVLCIHVDNLLQRSSSIWAVVNCMYSKITS